MIVVTGAGGFIGSALVWHLNQRGERDIVCSDLSVTADGYKNLAPLRFQAYMEHNSLLAQLQTGAWDGDLQCVFHLGACSNTTETDEDYLRHNNFEYSREICRATLKAGARFIQASSAATYGDGSNGYSDDHGRLRLLQPLNPYARSKHAFDVWALDEELLDRIVVLKYFNVYGPNEWHKGEMRSMVLKGFEQIRESGGVKLFRSVSRDYPDGGQRRDFIYVKDAVEITRWMGEPTEIHGVFNVGTGEANTWNRMMTAIFASLGREPQIEYIDMPSNLVGKYQHFTRAETAKLRSAGFKAPMTPLEDSVRDYVQHYLVPGAHLIPGAA